MPLNRIAPTARGKAAIASVIAASVGGWLWVGAQRVPAPVALAMTTLVQPWEGRKLKAYQDIVGVWTICDGETKGVRPGMVETPEGCTRRLTARLTDDFYAPLLRCVDGYDAAPMSWQAMMISLAYNVGVTAACSSSAARLGEQKQWRASCEAATRFNRAGGSIVIGLVSRREMGDAARIGEAELCVSGL